MKTKLHSVTVRLNDEYYQKFMEMTKNHNGNKTDTIKGMIDAGRYVNRPEIVRSTVELMDAIDTVKPVCTETQYFRLKKAGGAVCQSLLIN